jgi:hypothetical protein
LELVVHPRDLHVDQIINEGLTLFVVLAMQGSKEEELVNRVFLDFVVEFFHVEFESFDVVFFEVLE